MTSAAQDLDFPQAMRKVAVLLLGKPNAAMSSPTELRFGTKGSVSVMPADGTFYDHETKQGGGVLRLIQHVRHCGVAGALTWMEQEGLKEPSSPERTKRSPTFYDYADADGVVQYRVERRGKGCVPPFLQHGPDGRGGFHAARGCMQGVQRLPYKLPALLAADPTAIVFIVEGEKDVDNLTARGSAVATTNSGGAGKFGDELAPYFEGRRVVIIPDNDKAGRDHADDVATKLRSVVAELAILTVPGGEKSDVSDWMHSAGGSAFELLRKAEEALANTMGTPTKMLPILDPADWDSVDTPSREWALDQWIPMRQATYLTGPGSAGKSLVTQQLCTCIALGLPFMGIKTRQDVAIYITCEDDADELHRRQKAICAALGVPLSDLSGKLHLVSLMGEIGNELIVFDERDRATPAPRFAETFATAKHVGAGFVALDNVAHLTADEIARNKVAAFVNMLNRLARDIDGSVLFLGHPNKVGDPFSGSTAWENQVRSRLFLEAPREADGSIVDPDMRVLSRGKANYSRNGETVQFRWHQWAFVRDEDLPANVGAEISAIVQANAENERFLICLRERNRQHRAVSEKVCKSYAPKVFAAMPEAKGTTKRAMELAMDRLFRIGAIERAPVWLGDDRKPVFGLREMSAGNVQNMSAGDSGECAGNAAGNSGPHTPLDTTYQSGAPLGVGAPEFEDVDHPASQPIHNPFPHIAPAADRAPTNLSDVVFVPTDVERAAVLRQLITPLLDDDLDDE